MHETKVSDKVKIDWITEQNAVIGNAYGYSVHNKMMRKFSEKVMDFDPQARVALTIAPADQFIPQFNRFNALFTMWEWIDVPQSYHNGLKTADAIIVPCKFCRDIFQPIVPDKPIEVCWEGVDPDVYTYKERKFNPKLEKFRFLWVGAPNPRKGYPLVLEIIKILENVPNVEIYIKTTTPKVNWRQSAGNIWRRRGDIFRDFEMRKSFLRSVKRSFNRMPRPGLDGKVRVFGKHKNIFFDTRNLPLSELVQLYHNAHCFIFPTFGEGWGLTLCEAMATGCPSIATPITGVTEFFDESVGYTLGYEVKKQTLKNYKLQARGYVPDTRDLLSQMVYVSNHYREAVKKANAGATRIHNKFTWQKSASRLRDLIQKFTELDAQQREGERETVEHKQEVLCEV